MSSESELAGRTAFASVGGVLAAREAQDEESAVGTFRMAEQAEQLPARQKMKVENRPGTTGVGPRQE